jgi:hypothetical protein
VEPREPEEEEELGEQDLGGGEALIGAGLISSNNTGRFQQCVNYNSALLTSSGTFDGSYLRVRVEEGFHSAFRNGTRIRLQFENVGPGVSIFVPITIRLQAFDAQNKRASPSTEKPLPSGAPGSGLRLGTLAFVPTDSEGNAETGGEFGPNLKLGLAALRTSDGRAFAIYQVNDSEPIADKEARRRATIRVYVSYLGNSGLNLPGLGVTTLITAFDPQGISAAIGSANSFPHVGPQRTLFIINSCNQSLVFPFVTDTDGADTRIVISNTSLDMFGTTTQSGKVTFGFYGLIGQQWRSIRTDPIPAGEQLVFSLANGGNYGMPAVPGFQGYVIAQTDFQYCHGMAFIRDPRGFSSSYHAHQIDRYSDAPTMI